MLASAATLFAYVNAESTGVAAFYAAVDDAADAVLALSPQLWQLEVTVINKAKVVCDRVADWSRSVHADAALDAAVAEAIAAASSGVEDASAATLAANAVITAAAAAVYAAAAAVAAD